MSKLLDCFKAYDVRGKLDLEIDNDIAYRIGRSIAQNFDTKNIVVGFDARKSSPDLAKAVSKGICDAGSNVSFLGLAGTEEMYWGVVQLKADAGIEVTASHNPIEYNGMKFVKFNSHPLTQKEFLDVKQIAEQNSFIESSSLGLVFDVHHNSRIKYVNKILSFVDLSVLKPLKIVINSGNGAAGPTVDALINALESKGVRTNFVKLHHSPDPSFPNGIPNPLLEENRNTTAEAVKKEKADFGVAFDGDFDRCFFFDHKGNFISGEYIIGLLAEIFLTKKENSTIIHDPRVIWNTLDIIENFGGNAVTSKTGHAFIKEKMRHEDAIYGGEVSAHHYFRDFAYCDSGIIPWLLIWEHISKHNVQIAEIINTRRLLFPSSGEINFKVSNSSDCIEKIKNLFSDEALMLNELDGLSMSFGKWRFNLRSSNTEPLVRLNVETKGDQRLLKKQTVNLANIIATN